MNLDEMKDKILAKAGAVAGKSVEVAKVAADKAVILGKITKLNTDMAKERENLRKTYAEMGKMYYEQYKDDAQPDFRQACEDITQMRTIIEAKKLQTESLKSELGKFSSDSDYEYYESDAETEQAASDEHQQEPPREESAQGETPNDETAEDPQDTEI